MVAVPAVAPVSAVPMIGVPVPRGVPGVRPVLVTLVRVVPVVLAVAHRVVGERLVRRVLWSVHVGNLYPRGVPVNG
ncbi:hypothetical protein ACFDTO_03015 [Microbacteriaceae bacterium 4G12]